MKILSFALMAVLALVSSTYAATIVEVSAVTVFDRCHPMGRQSSYFETPTTSIASRNDDLPFRVRIFPARDGGSQQVQVVGNLFSKVMVQARLGHDSSAPLVGNWSSINLPSGHSVITCASNGSAVSSLDDVTKKAQVTYTWLGRCQEGINFFVYVLRDLTDSTWSYTRVPCAFVNLRTTTSAPVISEAGFTAWSAYGACSVTCGQGVKQRRRTCLLENICEGNTTESISCQMRSCQAPCLNRFLRCDVWSIGSACRGNFGSWLQRNCPRSCGVCNVPTSRRCVDNQAFKMSCFYWSRRQLCTSERSFWKKVVRERCPASCRIC